MSDAVTAIGLPPSQYPPFPDPGWDASAWETLLGATQVIPVSAIGYDCTPAWSVARRVLQDSMWYWIESGQGEGYVGAEENRFAFGPGDLLLLPRGVPQGTWSAAGSSPRVYTVHFYADVFGSLDLLTLFHLAGRISPGKDVPAGRVTVALARLFAHKPPGWNEEMSHLIWELLLALMREPGQMRQPVDATGWRSLTRLQPVLEHIDRNLHEPALPIAELAALAHVSEVYLRRLFHTVFRQSPIQVIRARRMERACLLLRTTGRGIKEIATLCGFTHTAFFHKTFKRTLGVTPSAYRTYAEFDVFGTSQTLPR